MLKKAVCLSILLVSLLTSCGSLSTKKESTELQKAIRSLSANELSTLETFFRTLLGESQGGYVLYGNKPICVEGFPIREEGTVFLEKWIHIFSTKLKKGALLWKKLGLNKYCKDYILFVYEKPVFDKWVDFVLINKQEFYRVVQDNLPLFQYVLGPKVTPSELLIKMADSKETFHSVLRDDRVLIGILLGYGTENSLYGSRSENIQDTSSAPSFGFTTLNEEISWLKERQSVSISLGEEKIPSLPRFSYYENRETKLLIDGYKRTQKRISELLKSEHFLEDILSKLFKEEITINAKKEDVLTFSEPNQLTKIVAQSLWNAIPHNERNPEYIGSFFSGLNANEKGVLPLLDNEYTSLVIRYYRAVDECTPQDPEFLALRREVAYSAGLKAWNHFKLGRDFYSLSNVMDLLSKAQAGNLVFPPIDSETDQILTCLHSVLYQREEIFLQKESPLRE
jgi:hypothetical protein